MRGAQDARWASTHPRDGGAEFDRCPARRRGEMGVIAVFLTEVASQVPWVKLAHEQALGVAREVSLLSSLRNSI